jgi:hypothetical protein
MRIPVVTNHEPIILAIKIRTKSSVPMRIRVCDAYKPDTNFTDRTGLVDGERMFYIRMPKTPETVVAQVYNANIGDKQEGIDPSFEIVSKEILTLDTFPETYKSNSELVKCAVKFIQDFSERAGILSAGPSGSEYVSDCGRFRIDYLDVIRDRKTGKELATPARISQDRGIIEVSKKHFLKYAVPYRVAILLHEISHFYLNDDPHNEIEADLNALKIFLGLGYGYIDAENAFLNVFKGSPSDQNKERHQILHNFIVDFEERYNKHR